MYDSLRVPMFIFLYVSVCSLFSKFILSYLCAFWGTCAARVSVIREGKSVYIDATH